MKTQKTIAIQNTSFQKKSSKNRAGMTLIETLLAMIIFSLFITGACKLLLSNHKLLDMARENYTASNIAKDRMETIRSFDFDQIPEFNQQAIIVDASGIPSPYGNFLRTTTVNTLMTNVLHELSITVHIKNRKTLEFNTEGQTIGTYIANHI